MRDRIMKAAIALLAGSLTACAGGSGERHAAPALDNGSFHADLNGVDIHYEVHGSGPVLMTVPNSWGLSLEGLRAFYRPLEDALTMVYFDPRGMGESGPVRDEADLGAAAVRGDFEALRRHLGLERVNAIGWSNGATNLLLLASERPASLDSAIYVHAVARFGPEDQQAMVQRFPSLVERFKAFQERMQNPDLTGQERDAAIEELMVKEWFPLLVADPDQAGPLLERVYDNAQFSFDHWRYSQTEWPTFDMRPQLPSIPTRSLVIAGVHDLLPVERARELTEGLPNAELAVFEHSGHFAPVEEPEKFRQAVLGFLTGAAR